MEMPMTKKRLALTLTAALWLALAGPSAAQEFQPSGDADLDSRLRSLIQGSFLHLDCPVPAIQPLLCNLKRSSSPNRKHITEAFIGGAENVIGEQPVSSPIWGKGTKIKAGTVIFAREEGAPQSAPEKRVEVSPAQIDFFASGFIYQNNITHRAVHATNVKYQDSRDAVVSYSDVYSEEEGRKAAKALISQLLGELSVPDGFRIAESDSIQTEGERLYIYRAQPEFLTSYPVFSTNGEGQTVQSSIQAVAVPVLDSFVQLTLDGDKLLCSLEYFWDAGMSMQGSKQEAMHAGEAVLESREWLMKRYDNSPPLLTVWKIRLGFIQDRSERGTLIPAWLFDAGSEQRVREEIKGGAGATESFMRVRNPFAVNALTGECIDL
jgi:hypothetical protein